VVMRTKLERRQPHLLEQFPAWALAGVCLLAVGCGARPQPVMRRQASPSVESVKKQPVRWRFFEPEFPANVRIDLGSQGVLYAGADGRRALVAVDGQCHHAAVPLPHTIIGGFASSDGTLTFLTEMQGVYMSKEPLGSYQTRVAPEFLRVPGNVLHATGRQTFVIERSEDTVRYDAAQGKWVALDLPKAPFWMAQLNLDSSGIGSALFLPYWLLTTKDDGATWQTAPSGTPSPTLPSPPTYEVSVRGVRTLGDSEKRVNKSGPSRHLVGSEIVEISGSKIRVGTVDASPADHWAEPFSEKCDKMSVSGANSDITVGCKQDRGVELARWNGTVWSSDGVARWGRDQVITGPNGWVLAYAGLVPAVRTTHGAKYVEITPALEIQAAAVDRSRRRVIALGKKEQKLGLWSASLDSDTFEHLADVEPSPGATFQVSLGSDGAVYVYTNANPPTIARYAPNGRLRWRVFPPVKLLFAIVGDHALGRGVNTELMESADGGLTWEVVNGHGSSQLYQCSEAGCLSWESIRIGWELPIGAKGRLRALDRGPTPKTQPKIPSAQGRATTFDCNAAGPARPANPDTVPYGGDPGVFRPFAPFREGIDMAGDTRFGYFETLRNGTVQAVVASTSNEPRRVALLGPPARARGVMLDKVFDPRGLVAVRYTHGGSTRPDDPPSPGNARIEVAWFDSVSQKVYQSHIDRAFFTVLPRDPSFDFETGTHCLASIDESGLVLHPFDSQSAWRFRRDGTVDPVLWPRGANEAPQDMLLDGERLYIVETLGSNLQVFRSQPPFAHWQTALWPWNKGSNFDWQLLRAPGRVEILHHVSRPSHQASWLFPLDPLPPEPSHHPVKLQPNEPTERPEFCSLDELGGLPLRVVLQSEFATSAQFEYRTQLPVVRVSDREIPASCLALRVERDGRVCLAGGVFEKTGDVGVLLAPHDPAHAWLIEPDYTNLTTAIRRLRCSAQTAP
jgi:hypothetical protein